jgi:hypothetical protein
MWLNLHPALRIEAHTGARSAREGMAMEYRAVQFQVVQTHNPCCWKWIVFLDATRMRTGVALTRADAVLDAEVAIDVALDCLSRPRAVPYR